MHNLSTASVAYTFSFNAAASYPNFCTISTYMSSCDTTKSSGRAIAGIIFLLLVVLGLSISGLMRWSRAVRLSQQTNEARANLELDVLRLKENKNASIKDHQG